MLAVLAVIVVGGAALAVIHAVSPTTASRVDAASAPSPAAGPPAAPGSPAAPPIALTSPATPPVAPTAPRAPAAIIDTAAARTRALAVARLHLTSPSPRVQRSAALALARACEPDALTALGAALSAEPSAIARIAIADALARCGDARGTDALIAAQADPRREVRADAAKALSLQGDARGEPFLRRLLHLPSHRLGAAEVLALRGDAAALALLAKIHADPRTAPDERTRAAIALAATGHADAVAAARRALDDAHFRPAAAAALARTGDAAGRPALVATLAIAGLRVEAALGLRRLDPGLDAAPLLPPLLDAIARERDVDQPSACEAILILTAPPAPERP